MANSYSNLSIDELEEVYSVTKANYGNIDGDLLDEINRRGGEAAFRSQVESEKQLKPEKVRIASEVALLMKRQPDPEFAKTLISSTLLSEQELSDFIDKLAKQYSIQQFNARIDSQTILTSIIGLVIGAVIGAAIAFLQILFLANFYYITLIPVYIVSWLILRMITKKDARNPVVLVTAVLATILGPGLTLWLLLQRT